MRSFVCSIAICISAFAISCSSAGESSGVASSAQEIKEHVSAGIVACGTTTCSLETEVCCVRSPLFGGQPSFTCKAESACKAGLSGAAYQAPQACDGPEDCSGTSAICCATVDMRHMDRSGVHCVAACKGDKWEALVCHDDTDCTGTRKCTECQPPGGSAVKMCVENGECPF